MSVTINFSPPVDSDVVSVKVYSSETVGGEYSHVYTEAITPSSTSVTYAAGDETHWYKISFVDSADNESLLSTAVYGGGQRWSDYMIPLIKAEINDLGTTQRYTDLEIRKKLVVAAAQLDFMADMYDVFDYDYCTTIDAGDGTNWNISPDPIYTSKDVNFVNLWVLKFLCNDAQSSLSNATSNAIKIKDGDSSIDTSAGFNGYKQLLDSDNGPCQAFQAAWKQLLFSDKNGDGNTKKVYGNFGSDYNHRYWNDDGYGGIDDRSSF